MYFRLSTHYKSNTSLTSNQDTILAVVKEMMNRGKLLLIMPEYHTDEEFEERKKTTPFTEDVKTICDWIEVIP